MGMSERTLVELSQEALTRGLEVKASNGKKISKMDYINALADKYLDTLDLHDQLTPGIRWVYNNITESPMLAQRQSYLKPDDFEKLLNSEEVIADTKVDGCFSWDTPILLSDGSTLPIGKIVDKKLNVEVMSYDLDSGSLVKRPITGWFNNGIKSCEDWRNLKPNSGRNSALNITNSHKVYTEGRGWLKSKDLIGSDYLKCVELGLNPTQKQIIYGTLLGDGAFHSDKYGVSTRISFSHSEKQYDYFYKKFDCLGSLTGKLQHLTSGFGSKMLRCNSKALKYISTLERMIRVPDGADFEKGRKTVTREYLDLLEPLGLAIWFMDDGSRSKTRYETDHDSKIINKLSRVSLAVNGFSLSEIEVIREYFYLKGMLCSVIHDKRGDKGYFLVFSSTSSQAFFNIVAPYVVESLNYKLPEDFRDIPKIAWWEDSVPVLDCTSIGISYNKSCSDYVQYKRGGKSDKLRNSTYKGGKYSKAAYDIEVEGTHCYFAGGILVHNCRMLTYYSPDQGFEFFGRNRSTDTFFFMEYAGQIKGLEDMASKFNYSFCLDCELVSTNPSINGRVVTDTVLSAVTTLLSLETIDSHAAQESAGYPLRFKAFDLLMIRGENLMGKLYKDRRYLLEKVVSSINQLGTELSIPALSWFSCTDICYGGKEAKMEFYKSVVGKGCDGIILKPLDSKYSPVEARQGHDGWVKMKTTMSEALGHDIDAFVSGYSLGEKGKAYENLVGTLEFSVLLSPSGKEHVLAAISGFSADLREAITEIGSDGIPCLKKSIYKTVAVIEGQDISNKNLRFMHARIVRFRDEKNWYDCQFPERELYNNVL